jgi:hypothetical protein
MFIARQRLGKRVPAATNTRATIRDVGNDVALRVIGPGGVTVEGWRCS